MNIYDKLNELTKALSESPEYRRYKASAEIIDANERYSEMVKDFLRAQLEISAAKMLGQEPSDEMIQNFNILYSSLSGISVINDFLQAQTAFNTIINDVTKGISKAAQVDADFLKILPDFQNMN